MGFMEMQKKERSHYEGKQMDSWWLMNRTKAIFFLPILFFMSAVPFVFAERKVFTFSADYTEATLAEGSEYTVLRGIGKKFCSCT
jgi:hypothetical protein